MLGMARLGSEAVALGFLLCRWLMHRRKVLAVIDCVEDTHRPFER